MIPKYDLFFQYFLTKSLSEVVKNERSVYLQQIAAHTQC